jgi:hypothetical protein
MRFLTGAGLLAFLILSGSVTHAALITFEFSGIIDSVYEPNNEFGGGVHAGDPFVVEYTFNTLAPDLLPADPNEGLYEGPTASLVLPGLTYVSTAGLDVHFGSFSTSLMFWTPQDALYQVHASFSGVSLSGDQLPIGWTASTGFLGVKTAGSAGMLAGTIIPEPTVLAMILVGLFWAARRSGRLR